MSFPMNIESWRLIDGYDNYEVSQHGRIRNNKTNLIRTNQTDKGGYKIICLTKEAKQKLHKIHRLVAFAFLENKPNDTKVDHIDHNRAKNMLNNLRWTTPSGNSRNRSKGKNNSSGI